MKNGLIYFNFVPTPFGSFQIAATEKGIVRIQFPGHRFRSRKQSNRPRTVKSVFKRCRMNLKNFFAGKRCDLNAVPIDWRFLSGWDHRILKALRKVPLNQQISYSELASKANVPRAARAVGNTLNRNPIPILIPCHRVIRKDGTLGGYSGGLKWKKRLIALERQMMGTRP